MTNLSKIERHQYVQSMLRELRDMAASGRDEFLTYLIEMAYVEVSDQIRAQHAKAGNPDGLTRAA